MLFAWIFAALAIGAHLAVASEQALAFEVHPLRSRFGKVTCIVGALLLAPASLALYLCYPDWSLMYLAHPDHLPPFTGPLLATAGPALAAALGFFVATRLEPPRLARLWVVGSAAAGGAVVVIGYRRIFAVSHYHAFHYGMPTTSLLDSALLVPLGLILATVVGVYLYVWQTLRRHAAGGPAES